MFNAEATVKLELSNAKEMAKRVIKNIDDYREGRKIGNEVGAQGTVYSYRTEGNRWAWPDGFPAYKPTHIMCDKNGPIQVQKIQ